MSGSDRNTISMRRCTNQPPRSTDDDTHLFRVCLSVSTWKIVMSLGLIALIVLVLILLRVLPTWRHSNSWGYGPSGIVGLIVLMLMGRL